jgi:hypothetical protein
MLRGIPASSRTRVGSEARIGFACDAAQHFRRMVPMPGFGRAACRNQREDTSLDCVYQGILDGYRSSMVLSGSSIKPRGAFWSGSEGLIERHCQLRSFVLPQTLLRPRRPGTQSLQYLPLCPD